MANFYEKTRINESGDFHTFNIMSALLSDIADLIERIRKNLVEAYKGVYSEYVSALNNLRTFKELVDSYYSMDPKKKEIFKLKITLAKYYKELNKFEEGAEELSDAFGLCLSTLKFKNALFPKKRNSMTFKDFVDNETK